MKLFAEQRHGAQMGTVVNPIRHVMQSEYWLKRSPVIGDFDTTGACELMTCGPRIEALRLLMHKDVHTALGMRGISDGAPEKGKATCDKRQARKSH